MESIIVDKRGNYSLSNNTLTLSIFPENSDNVGVIIIFSFIFATLFVITLSSSIPLLSIPILFALLYFLMNEVGFIARTNKKIIIDKEVLIINTNHFLAKYFRSLNFDKLNYIDHKIKRDSIKEVFIKNFSKKFQGNLYRLILEKTDNQKIILGEFKDLEFAKSLIKEINNILNLNKTTNAQRLNPTAILVRRIYNFWRLVFVRHFVLSVRSN
ncbi:MAG: hypothetical protein IPH97_17655 [Ignavibacteriales bacterium]|nr:hypothetical protein [Ignavibacteriales bacterium]